MHRFSVRLKLILTLLICMLLAASFSFSTYAQQTSLDVETDSEASSFWIEYVDVGQGDCAIIQCDGHFMMIDGGPASASSIVYTILKEKNIDTIDVMIATHPDSDHIGGLSAALNYAAVGKCYCSSTECDTRQFSSLVKYLKKQNRSIQIPTAGDKFLLGSATVEILGPLTEEESNNNNSSIIVKITYGDNSFLFMGDAEREEERSLIAARANLYCDVLKVAHHGSSSSTSFALLRRSKPAIAIISVGNDNTYGHPTEDVLSKLNNQNIDIYRTDLQGDIICSSDGKNISMSVEKAGGKSNVNIITPDTIEKSADNADSNLDSEYITYVLNVRSKKFHYPDCSSVSDMKAKNRKDVSLSREEILAEGYRPCQRCNP